jgi:diguanylate cyclase (GGDEF)-like protein
VVEVMNDERPLLVEDVTGAAEELRSLGRERALTPGEAVWDERAGVDEVAFVVEGRLAVVRRTADGREVTIEQLHPGALAAEETPAGSSRLTTVRAIEPSRVLLIGADSFRALLDERTVLLQQLFWMQVRGTRRIPSVAILERDLTDPLTGLYQKGFFCERLGLELDRARLVGDTLIVALFDVDRLGHYERTHGPAAAERVVQKAAALLRKMGRRGDVAARFGEDEFVTLLYGATASDGWRFAEAYRGAIMATNVLGNPEPPPRRVTVSGGIASFPQDGRDETTLVSAARARLARAKQAGGNCIVGIARPE